jgi:hypothetical protein
MTMATLAPCLDVLRSEFNRNFPRRDKASDGWIGDTAHQNSKSDHNPDSRGIVHAIDVDEDLRAPGATMWDCVNEVVGRHRAGRDNRLTYVIYERTIWSASYDWRPREYTLSNPHDKHAHFSASYVRAREENRASFGVEDIVTQADRDDIVNRVVARLKAELPPEVWQHKLRNPYSDVDQEAGTILRYVPSRNPHEITWRLIGDLATMQQEQAAIVRAIQAGELADDAKLARLEELAVGIKAVTDQLTPTPPASPQEA